ncbi:hypothetical protein XA68_14756 [Ophiocordyceps unilateralis]|uniref:Uncharacterized protein n=1 Tax=Ophiocordyceps unilateralis TaxID=268505 RepID=A0A2A9P9Z0_OPHUN|nr:hypothetical protein XA68_14756 [Ophiocordyceps unilateralis]
MRSLQPQRYSSLRPPHLTRGLSLPPPPFLGRALAARLSSTSTNFPSHSLSSPSSSSPLLPHISSLLLHALHPTLTIFLPSSPEEFIPISPVSPQRLARPL